MRRLTFAVTGARRAYGNIVYSKAPAVLRQAEFCLGEDAFRRGVQAFAHTHAFGAADWNDLVRLRARVGPEARCLGTRVGKLSSRERFRIIERLLALGDRLAGELLSAQAQADKSDDGRRYAYAAAAARPDPESKWRGFLAFLDDASLPESWIDESLAPFNTVEHEEWTSPFLETALEQLPDLKRARKIFFVNYWLASFLAGQTSAEAVTTVKRFLRETKLDPDLRRKVLEHLDGLERTVAIRRKFG